MTTNTTSTQYHTSDNRVFASFEAARAHCIAHPKVAMSRSPSARRYARKAASVDADTPPEMSDAALQNRDNELLYKLVARVASLEAQVASLLAAKQPKPRATVKVGKAATKPITFRELPADDQPF